jgi:hypothetical protein
MSRALACIRAIRQELALARFWSKQTFVIELRFAELNYSGGMRG